MKTLATLLFTIIFIHPSYAQEFTRAGTCEAGGGISFSSTTSGAYTIDGSSGTVVNYPPGYHATTSLFTFDPYFGVMLGSGIELGIMGSITHHGGSVPYTDYAGFFTASYNIHANSILYPYIEPFIGYASAGTVSQSITAKSALGMGGDAGLKIIIGTHGLIVIKVQYLHQEREYDIYYIDLSGDYFHSTTSYYTNTIFTGMGFRLFFGGKKEASAGEQKTK